MDIGPTLSKRLGRLDRVAPVGATSSRIARGLSGRSALRRLLAGPALEGEGDLAEEVRFWPEEEGGMESADGMDDKAWLIKGRD